MYEGDDFIDEIREDLCKRLKAQPNSMAASEDEVRIAYLLGTLDKLYQETESLKSEIETMHE